LISADFLDSDYCNDIEMARALEHHQEETARVIPIILRPADWESSRFGTLQPFPKDGKPVIKWTPNDDGFLDVAKGLRQVVKEMQPGTVATKVPASSDSVSLKPPSRWRGIAAAIAAMLICVGGLWQLWPQSDDPLLEQAQTYMDMGRYAEAKTFYEQALKQNPSSPQARFGLAKAGLPELRGDAEKFAAEVDFLLKKAPEDSDLIIFDGDRFYDDNQFDEALQRYQKAISINPNCAEAFCRRGVIYDRFDDAEQSLTMYQKAADLARETPHYRNNLAYAHYRQGHYKQAIEEYQKIDRYPLAALELAKVYWLKGELAAARDAQTKALRWLENNKIFALPRNQGPWYFPIAENQGVRVSSREEKICYAQLSLAAKLSLQDKTAKTAIADKVPKDCDIYLQDLTTVLHSDLQQAQIEHVLTLNEKPQ
jgi:tetratricopeptide (TPR) repeat protein